MSKALIIAMAMTLAMSTGASAGIPFVSKHKSEPEEKSKQRIEKSQPKDEKQERSAVEPKFTPQTPYVETANATELDTALLSVLRDVNKSLRESEDSSKLEDPAQRAALKAALDALDASLSKSPMQPNRIVPANAKDHYERNVLAESWDSGDIELPDGTHASLNVLWAKKVNGLLNISIAGNCGCKANSSGERTGEYVVVINGKSTLDSGFDIQSQSNVNFWLGKLNGISIDATTCGDSQTSTNTAKPPVLKALMTESRRKAAAQEAATAPAKKPEPAAEATSPTPEPTVTTAIATLPPATPAASQSEPREPRTPSKSARIVIPQHAIAGDYITVSVLNDLNQPEPFVEVSFNDYKTSTGPDGKVIFQIPEDALPGPTIAVSLTALDEEDSKTAAIDILQPLMRPSETDLPRIDKVTVNKPNLRIPGQQTLIIDGHNFDGTASNNHVIIDGDKEATVIVSSPVQLKAIVTGSLNPGNHNVIVQRKALRSEPISYTQQSEEIVAKPRKKS